MQVSVVPVTPFQQNASILRCEASGKGAIVDPGGDLDAILAAVERDGVEIEKVLLTHGHVDHAAGATALAQRLGVPIHGPHEDDRFWLESLPDQAQMFGLPAAEVVVPDLWFVEGDTVEFGEVVLEVLHCPGHTPGHVAFFDRAGQLAIVGDLLFQGSIGRTDFPKGDYDTLIRSLQEKILPLGDDVRFISGHGPNSTIGEERRTNPFLLDPDRFRGMV